MADLRLQKGRRIPGWPSPPEIVKIVRRTTIPGRPVLCTVAGGQPNLADQQAPTCTRMTGIVMRPAHSRHCRLQAADAGWIRGVWGTVQGVGISFPDTMPTSAAGWGGKGGTSNKNTAGSLQRCSQFFCQKAGIDRSGSRCGESAGVFSRTAAERTFRYVSTGSARNCAR